MSIFSEDDNSIPEVVISGIGGCFPKADNIEELKKHLLDQVDMIGPARWKDKYDNAPNMAGVTPSITHFDANFFAISARVANSMDPMARLLLEKSFEALIDAGVHPKEVRGKNIGVYMATCLGENDSILDNREDNGVGAMGSSRAMMANRISYILNLTGPSSASGCTWAGGVNVIKQGYDAIKLGQIDAAIVGTANVAVTGTVSQVYSSCGLLNHDGKTKAFDDCADGYARSDSICVFYLQKADNAKRHYATIVNCDVEFNGHQCDTFCNLNVENLSNYLTTFYKEAKVDPKDVQYVETYGCGIKIIDEKELESIDTVYNKNRNEPLLIGSVKSNLGHTEAAASMLGIVKVIIAMETGVIPGNLHYETPNNNIPALVTGKVKVVSENRKWTPALAAVNALGLSSAFGHILLKPNNRVKDELLQKYRLEMPMLHFISSRTAEGMNKIIDGLKTNPVIDPEYSRLLHDVFARTFAGHLYRGYVLRGEENKDTFKHFDEVKPQIWFVYPGMGCQWITMGKGLLNLPIFAQSIERCYKILKPFGVDLKRIICDDDPTTFDCITNSFVGIAAIQIALTDILHAIGIVPDGIIGHSVGELGCAYADGCLTAEEVMLATYCRGKVSLESELIPGMMAAIGIGAKEMKEQCPPTIDIACHNGPNSCTISGPKEAITQFVAELHAKNIFARMVNVSDIAYHSRYIKIAAPRLLHYMKDIIPDGRVRSAKWICTSVEESAWDSDLAKTVSAEYLTNNLLSPVYFEEGLKYIPNNAVVIEIAPHGLLQAILKDALSSDCIYISLTKRNVTSSLQFLGTALGNLYINGIDMELSHLYPHIEYPVSRGTKSLSTIMRWFHKDIWRAQLQELMTAITDENFVINLDSEQFRHLLGHRVGYEIVIPVTTYLPIIYNLFNKAKRSKSLLFEDIVVKRNIVITEKGNGVLMNIIIKRSSGAFEICDNNGIILSGQMTTLENYETAVIASPPFASDQLCCNFNESDFQNELNYRGYQFSGVFNSVKQMNMYNAGSTASIEWRNDWSSFLNAMVQVGMLGETCDTATVLPTFIRRLIINFDELRSDREEMDITYDFKTRILTSSIAQFKDLQFGPCVKENRSLTADTYKFIKYSEDTQDLQLQVNICLQIVQQSIESKNPLYLITEIKNSEINSLENYIYNYSVHHYSSKIELRILNDTNKHIPRSSLCIIGEQQLQQMDLLFNKQRTAFILACLPSKKRLSPNTKMSIIHSFHFGAFQYYLLKQTCNQIPLIINITSKCFNSSDLQNNALPWVKQLHESLNSFNKHLLNIYLVSTILPENGIEIFFCDVKNIRNFSNIRLMYLLDEYLPECAGSTEFYQEIFQKDLPVTVFKNGHWGSYFKIPYIKFTKETAAEINAAVSVKDLSSMFRDFDVNYLGLNAGHLCVTNENRDVADLGPVDYTGYNMSGQRVMGIARVDIANKEIRPDPDLVWPIPDSWLTIDGATVPYAYTCAYYVLFELLHMERGNSVLVHNGCSTFGQAVIRIAHQHHCVVFTTVGSELQRASLLNFIPKLSPYQVMAYNNTAFKEQIQQYTNGEGVNLVINCLTGEGLHASLYCINPTNARVVLVDISDSDSSNIIGLRLFVFGMYIYGFTSKIILDKSRETKLKIRTMVLEGLNKGVVKPFERTVVTEANLDSVLRNLKSDQITSASVLQIKDLEHVKNPQIFKSVNFANPACKNNVSYIVFGTDTEKLMYTMRWLAMNGAKLIAVFATNINLECDLIKRRINSLKTQYDTDIIVVVNGINIETTTPTTLRDIHEIKEIGALIIILNKQSLPESLIQVDAQLIALSSTAHLICFWEYQTNMTYTRPNLSLSVSNVNWAQTDDFFRVVKILKHILEEPADIFIQDHEFTSKTMFSPADFFALLSKSHDSIISTVDSISTATDLIQYSTVATRDIREALPAFIVPGLLGLKCIFLRTLLQKLLCTVYIVNYGFSNSLKSVATTVVKQIKQKSQGSYNIIGISVGGALALEITKILEEQGEQTQLYLIDGVPETIHDITNIKWLESSLLSALLRIDAFESNDSLRSDWNEKVKNALQRCNYKKRELPKITNGLNIIRNKLNQVLNYMPRDGKTISGTTRLLRPRDSSKDFSNSLRIYCKQVIEKIFKGNHFTFLETDTMAEYINETLIIPPLYH